MKSIIRPLAKSEYPLIKDFLYDAIFVPEGETPPPHSILDLPELRIYYENFGIQAGDIALAAEQDNQVKGLVWLRIIEDYGHIDDSTPSLSIAVKAPCRGQGIGTALLLALFEAAKEAGYTKVSLSVQKENPAYRLYQRLGFVIHKDNGGDLVMWRAL